MIFHYYSMLWGQQVKPGLVDPGLMTARTEPNFSFQHLFTIVLSSFLYFLAYLAYRNINHFVMSVGAFNQLYDLGCSDFSHL